MLEMLLKILVGFILHNSLTMNNVVAKKAFHKTLDLAVVPMTGFERFYHDVGPLNLARSTKISIKNEKSDEKKVTCETIFRNPAMVSVEAAEPVDPTDMDIQDELRANRPDIFDRHYVLANDGRSKFSDNYRKYNFSVGGVSVSETVFPCLARKRSSNNIDEYLVSHEYASTGNEKKLASRFMLLRDGGTNEVTFLAIVDKAVDTVYPINPKYCERSELTDPGRSKELCELPEIQRIRLCAILFNSKNYSRAARFVAPSVAPECRESKLSLRCAEKGSLGFTASAVECPVTMAEPDSNSPVLYYVTRGLRTQQLFVATSIEGSEVPVVKEVFTSDIFTLTPLQAPEQPVD